MQTEPTPQPIEPKHCVDCGAALVPAGKFCPACGAPAGGPRSRERSRSASVSAAGAVFAGFLAVGAVALYFGQQDSRPPQRAVSGAPSATPGGTGNVLPPEHPPIELPEEAVKLLDELAAEARAAPDDVNAWQRLARGRYRAALIDPSYASGAKEALDTVLRLDPDNLEALRTRGNLAYDMREYAEAQRYLERYLELDPTDPGVKTDLASCLLFQGDREGAKTRYREVIAARPDFVQAHLNLGIALHADGDREASSAALKSALDHAKTPEQREQVERIVALAETRPSADSQAQSPNAAGGSTSSGFQQAAESALRTHPIVGPKIVSIEWSDLTTGVVSLREFPMDTMPAVMRNKFKSRINETLADSAERDELASAAIRIDLVDDATKRVMDTLDGREWVGAFDEVE